MASRVCHHCHKAFPLANGEYERHRQAVRNAANPRVGNPTTTAPAARLATVMEGADVVADHSPSCAGSM
jgi:hypothetical protein